MLDPTSILFITLDSCRYDTFEGADVPNMRSVGPVHKAKAPGNFTFAYEVDRFYVIFMYWISILFFAIF